MNEETNEGGAMLGAAEFTVVGNVMMGIMAIAGVGAMLYAVGTSMTDTKESEWTIADHASAVDHSWKKAA